MVPMLQGMAAGAFRDLKRLDLLSTYCDDAAPAVRALLEAGGCQHLQELNISVCSSGEEYRGLMGVIADGSCPELSRLSVSSFSKFQEEGLVTRAMEQEQCRRLRELILVGAELEDHHMQAMATALEGGCCPDLRWLQMAHCHMRSASGLVSLGRALQSGCCPRLEVLILAGTCCPKGSEVKDGILAVMDVLRAGCLPSLKRLDVSGAGMSALGVQALARAVKACPKLEYLDVSGNDQLGDVGVTNLIRALSSGCCPQLGYLGLSKVGMSQGGVEALVKICTEKALPVLMQL